MLKPGGRLAISDLALKKPLPDELAADVSAYVGCIAGALMIDEYRRGLREAGFSAVQVIETGCDLNAYALIDNQAGCCTPSKVPSTSDEPAPVQCSADGCGVPLHARLAELLARYNINDYAASVRIYAMKP